MVFWSKRWHQKVLLKLTDLYGLGPKHHLLCYILGYAWLMWCYPAPIFPHCQYTEIIHKSDYHTAVDELDHLKSSHLNSKNISFCSHEYLESLECWISKCLSTVFSLMVSLLNSFRDNNSIYKILWSLFSFKNNNYSGRIWFMVQLT